MQIVDTLINAKWIIPVEPAEHVLDDHCVVIKNGLIVDILPIKDAASTYQAQDTFHLDDHALIPGLINTHTHAAMSLLRGYADDLALMDWLQHHIWPAEAKWVSPEFVYEGTQLAIAESIRSGVTCFNDMYFFPDEAANAAIEAGFRASIGLIVIDFPTIWAANADEYLQKALSVYDKYKQSDLISMAFAPHAPYTVSDDPLKQIALYAEELDVPIHMHVHETKFEVLQAKENNGKRPLARLTELGLVSPRLIAVHMTQLNNEEITLCANNGVSVIHCPESNMKLASGFCPVHELMSAGINVCIGTDGAASNNDLNMISELHSAALLAKVVAQDPTAVPAFTALEMATINGAKALGLDNITGSLVKGKAADITAIDLSTIETQPLYHPISQIVYSSSRDQVSHVWINGENVLKERELTKFDPQHLKHIATKWGNKMAEES